MILRPLIVVGLLGASLASAADHELKRFLATHCYGCHGEEKQKGDRRFDQLQFPPHDARGVLELQDLIDQLTLGDMPPKKAKIHPSDAVRAQAIAALRESVSLARESLHSTGGQTILRRLNRREYLHSVSDLLALDLTAFDPTTRFPTDQVVAHMDNIGAALVTSGYLLDQQLEAADLLVEKALGDLNRPNSQRWHFKGNFRQGQELSYAHKNVYDYRYLCVYEVPNTTRHEGGYAALEEFKEGVPADGYYEVKALAHARNREHPYDPKIFGMNMADPFRLGIVPGDHTAGILHHPQPIEPQLAEVTVRDGDKPEWYTMKVWLNQGQTPRFIFPNGMRNCRQAFGAIAKRYRKDWPKNDPFNGGIVQARRIVLQHGKMPHIRIHEVEVNGPLREWPPRSHTIIFGPEGFKAANTRPILKRFAERAYRRPTSRGEIDRLMTLVSERRKLGHSPRQALIDALKSILCSPAFLYLSEPGRTSEGGTLSPHDLAARLSYFLWSTTPDDELRACADDGSIMQPHVRAAQLQRLLTDPRSERFIAGFLDSWLNLRALGDMPPDRDTFGIYYAKDLQNAMKRETQLFTRHLIEENRPITDFLDADYTFLNRPLARLYGLDTSFDPARAHLFQKVTLPDRRRGGLLGMASVLTVTANGIETSPVTRGVWLLENILGTPPTPPPDDVPTIDPDLRGTTTVRDQLTKHRDTPACFECHRKIDPPGFALENFDPIGAWRTHYPQGKQRGPAIDSSGQLSNGTSFQGIVEFKALLLDRQDLFARNLTRRLLAYATGRRMEALDRAEIDRIVREHAEGGHGLRLLIEKCVASEIFLSP